MATKKKPPTIRYENPPENLDSNIFFGITPDQDQKVLIDDVWSRKKKVFLVDSIAGSGKTLISVAMGVIMTRYGFYDRVVYITFPGIYEKTQGFLPGDLTKKSEPYFQPLYDALLQLNEDPNRVCYPSQLDGDHGDAFIECAVSTYMRGINIENAFVIVDEAENADLHTLTKVLSRIHDSCTVMVIGHAGQCDMYDKTRSGFTACIDYQIKNHPDICGAYTLRHNHRGWISQWSDLMLEKYKEPQFGFIYMTRNNVNGKLYIGQHKRTMNPKDINDSWYLGSGKLLRRAIAKYGEDSFTREIIYECDSPAKLNYMEKVFIAYYNALGDEKFYNLSQGGDSVPNELLRHSHKPMSEEARKHMARQFTAETRKKLAEAARRNLTGKKHTAESRKNMSLGHIGSKSIYKNGKYMNVKQDKLDEYLADGWVLRSPAFGKIVVNKDGRNKRISPEELTTYIDAGWSKGLYKENKGKEGREENAKIDNFSGHGRCS